MLIVSMSMNYQAMQSYIGKNDMRPAVGCRTDVCEGTWQLFFTTSHWQRIAGPVEEAALDIQHEHCAQNRVNWRHCFQP